MGLCLSKLLNSAIQNWDIPQYSKTDIKKKAGMLKHSINHDDLTSFI